MKFKYIIILFLGLIIVFPIYAMEGAKQGLLLWFQTVLPTLLPFIILSNLIMKLNLTKPLSKLLYPPLHFLFGVSQDGCYPILIGALSGIPVGAKSINDLYLLGKISKEEATYLLGICNNASPMFIMSYVAIAQLSLPKLRFVILIIVYLSSILSTNLYFHIKKQRFISKKNKVHAASKSKIPLHFILSTNKRKKKIHTLSLEKLQDSFDFSLVDTSIMNGFEIITKVGGYIILFSIPAAIITNVFPYEILLKYLFIGALEITTGINQVNVSSLITPIKIVLTVGLTAFGGLSGLAQTKSVINESRLSIHTYLIMKLLNFIIAMILIFIYITIFGV